MNRSRVTAVLPGVAGLVIAFLWALLRSGFTMNPVPADMVAAALAWPDRYGDWMTQFYSDSPLYIIAFKALGLSSNIDLVRLGFSAGVASIAVLTTWMVFATECDGAWRAGRLIILSPIPAVIFISIGSYDPFTLLAWGFTLWVWLSGRRWLLVVVASILGFQHFEQTLMGSVALLLSWHAVRHYLPTRLNRLSPVWTIPGIFVGKGILVATLLLDGQSAASRSEWLQHYVWEWAKVAIVTGPFLLWSLFAGLWALVVAVWLRTESRRSRLLLLAAFSVGLFATMVSGDRPRVFVLVSAPSLALLVITFIRQTQDSPRERNIVEVVAWLAPPILLAGKTIINANIVDNAYVTLMWLTGLG
jgi:hypothetical protein